MMRISFRFSCFILCVWGLVACSDERAELLLGEWTATRITQDGDSMRLDPREVGFTFTEDGRYAYRSTLGYREGGNYRYERGYLFARDSTQPDRPERVVAIEHVSADSLIMRLRQDSSERIMILLRD